MQTRSIVLAVALCTCMAFGCDSGFQLEDGSPGTDNSFDGSSVGDADRNATEDSPGRDPGACGTCAGGLVCVGEQCVPPNIVLIMLDDADYRDFSLYNPETSISTPAIDALATQGLTFNNFYVNSPVCSPTRAAAQSGNYPARYGINTIINRWSRRGLPGQVYTIAEHMKSKGYTTGHIGKWHLGEERANGKFLGAHKLPQRPRKQGYDHTVTTGVWKGYWKTNVYVNNTFESSSGEHLDKLFTDHALDFLTAMQDKRFFLNLTYFSPHIPLEPPPAWAANYPNTIAGKYEALLTHTDHQIGRVLERIDDLGLNHKTAVLILSDNGGERSVHPNHTNPMLRGGKQHLFEGGVRSPLIVRWPGLTAVGSRNESVTAVMDIFPTIVALLGDNPTTLGFDGDSFAGALSGQLWQRSKPLFWQHLSPFAGGYTAGYIHNFAVRDGPWKLVKESGALYLFDISKDRAEINNLKDAKPSVVSSLLTKFSNWRRTIPRLPSAVNSMAGAVSRTGDKFTFAGRGHVLFEDHPLYDFHDGEFSVRFRIKAGRGGVLQRIIGNSTKWRLRLDTNNHLSLRVTDDVSGQSKELTGLTALQVGLWYDVAISFHNGWSHIPLLAQVFLDGALEINGSPAATVAFEPEALKLSTDIGSPDYFVGEVEGVKIFAGTLTASDL